MNPPDLPVSQETAAAIEHLPAASGSAAGRRLVYLEAARGIASIVVVFDHLSAAFLPNLIHRFPGGIGTTPFYFLINGNGAVIFFFVLSGFFLSIGLVQKPAADILITAAVKRLPRLALPAGLSILAGFAIIALGLNFNSQASQLSHSDWLGGAFANGHFLSIEHVPASFQGAITESIAVFLLPHHFNYNPNLWTMLPEFYGSLLAFAIAYMSGKFLRKSDFKYAVAIFAVTIFILAFSATEMACFVIGAALAYFRMDQPVKVSPQRTNFIFAVSFCLMCSPRALLTLIASAGFLFALIQSASAERLLSGRAGYWLGKFSFPIYLVHTLMIYSAGSFAYLFCHRISNQEWLAVVAAALVTLSLTFLAAIPFVMLEAWWLPTLNSAMRSFRFLVRRNLIDGRSAS